MEVDTETPYAIQQWDFGTNEYNQTINSITRENGYSFDLRVYANKIVGNFDYKVIALVDTNKGTIESACIVVMSQRIIEIYAYTKHKSVKKGVAPLLLSRLIDYHRDNNTGYLLWVGVEQKPDGSHMNLINKVYRPLGFYFPEIFETYSVGSNLSPLGTPQKDFLFFSGFWSSTLEQHAKQLVRFNSIYISNRDVRLQKLRNTFFNYEREVGGLFVIGERGHLTVKGDIVQSLKPEQCETPIPETDTTTIGYLFNFHTHPLVCHKKYDTYLGFPSTVDYNNLTASFMRKYIDGHFVFSVEGVFFIQSHPLIKYCLKNGIRVDLNNISDIMARLSQYFNYIGYEQKRKLPESVYTNLNNEIMRNTPEELEALNSFTQSRIIELYYDICKFKISVPALGGLNVPLFYLQFSYNHIDDQMFLVPDFYIRG